jgi:hypothetical protein
LTTFSCCWFESWNWLILFFLFCFFQFQGHFSIFVFFSLLKSLIDVGNNIHACQGLRRFIFTLDANPEVFDEVLKPLTIVFMAKAEFPHEYNLDIDSPIKKKIRIISNCVMLTYNTFPNFCDSNIWFFLCPKIQFHP